MELRLGCCASMIDPAGDPIGIASVEALAAMGFDYVELSLAHLAALPEADFDALRARLRRSGLSCEACNNFFPPRVRLTGPAADPEAATAYALGAMERAARLGVRVIVFGSSGAKNVPEGYPHDAAWAQVRELLARLAPDAERLGLTLAIEPISRPEANFILRLEEAVRMARAVDHAAVRVLVDFYHLRREGDGAEAVRAAAPWLAHAHVAAVDGRRFPTRPDADLEAFFDALVSVGYEGRCSIEAYTDARDVDGPAALHLLRQIIAAKV